jgi:RNA polymerase sigma-70 factor (ECF subfamily)
VALARSACEAEPLPTVGGIQDGGGTDMHEDTAVPLDSLLEQRSWIRALARSLVRDPATVDDIEQDVYVAAMRGPRVETSLRGWLRTVVRNAAYQRHRGESRRTVREQASERKRPARSPAAIVAEADSHRHVVQAVMELDEPYRSTVLVRYFEGLSLQETADRLGVPCETVKTRMRRAHVVLRERLRREHGTEHRGAPAILVPLVGGPSGLAELLRRVPDTVVASRPWTPLATAAGLVLAASLIGVAVHASTGGGEGDEGVVFTVAAVGEGDGDAGETGEASSGDPETAPAEERKRVRRPPPAEEEDADVEEPAPAALDHFVARDLYTRDPIPNLTLSLTTTSGLSSVTTDAEGRVDVAPAGVKRIECADSTWTVPGRPQTAALVDGSLWAHRTAEVDVTVVGSDPVRQLVPGTVDLIRLVEGVLGVGEERMQPGSFHFHTRIGLDRDRSRTRAGADGRARMSVPVVRGLRISGTAPGWRTGSVAVHFDESLRTQPVTVTLTSGLSFDGRVTNADGMPVPGVEILMKTARHIDAKQVDLAALRAEGGGGVSLGGSETKGWDVSWQGRVPITARGVFQGRVTADGDVLLIVTAPGYAPTRHALGRPTADVHRIEVKLVRLDPERRTLLSLNGTPVRQTKVLFHDVTGNPQISTYVETDEDGRFPSQMLVEGRRYTVGVRVPGDEPHELRLVTWDGRETIEVEELSQDFEGDDE